MTEGPADAAEGERIAKLIARAGLCSRRDAEAWIGARRVAVDGVVLSSPALRVRPGQRITVDGKQLPAAEATRLFRYHKPKGVVTSARDPEGRATIYDTLPEGLPRLMPVGRLDLSSEGLLLLTNDGALKRRLELPTLSLREGKNREVRRVLEHVGLTVNRLIRMAYGPFQLGHLAKRAVEEVPPKVLREQVGAMLELTPRLRPAAAAAAARG
jgi:23S rRNA pseudouridine2605 synthase